MTFDPTQFKNHEVTIYEKTSIGGVPFEFLRWQKPGTSWGLINYIFKGYELFVSGDWDDAIYAWSDNNDLQWIATLDIGYFNGKCKASPLGRVPHDWTENECMRQMRNQVNQTIQDYPDTWPKQFEENSDEEDVKARVEQFWEDRIKVSGASSAAYSKDEWLQWLQRECDLDDITKEEEDSFGSNPCNGEIFFGEEWTYEHPSGEVIAFTSETHLAALKLAMAWLKKSKEKWQTSDDVYWSDPDEGKCSRTLTINIIEYLPDDVVRIIEPDGSTVECLLSELS